MYIYMYMYLYYIYIYVHVSILDRHSPEPIAALASRGPGFQGIINKQPWLPGNDKVHFITLPQFQGDQKSHTERGTRPTQVSRPQWLNWVTVDVFAMPSL